MMQEDVDFFQKTTLFGPDYDKAIEALCASHNPINTKEANKRKALSLKDLLIKVRPGLIYPITNPTNSCL